MKYRFNQLLVLTLAGGIGLLVIAFLGQLRFPDSSVNFLGETKRAELGKNGALLQPVRIDHNGLEGFQIFMGNTGLSFGEQLSFKLLDANCQVTIQKQSTTSLSLPPINGMRFTFDPIAESRGEAYCLSIEYRPGLIDRRERPYIRATEGDMFLDASYTDTGKGKTHVGRTLQIRPLYAPDTSLGRLQELENRLSQYKPAFVKGLVASIGLIGILLGLLFFRVISRNDD